MYVVVLLVFVHEFSIFDEEESMNQPKKTLQTMANNQARHAIKLPQAF